MVSKRSFLLLALFISVVAGSNCSGPGNANTAQPAVSAANTANVSVAQTNVEELGLLVKVSYEADEIVWKEFTSPRRVVAALRFSPADSNKIVADAEALGPSETVTIAVETWFPEELVAQGEMSGDSALRGKAYRADAFFQEPYTNGRITRIDGTDYFILEVTAK